MRPALVAAWALVLLAAPAQGLTLLEDARDGEDRLLRLRVDEPPLKAQAGSNVSLAEANASPELSRLEVPLQEWRGYENTTTLDASGSGRLLLVDGSSGIVVPLEPNASSRPAQNASQADEPAANSSEEASSSSSKGAAKDSSDSSPSTEDEDAQASQHASGPGPGRRAAASDEQPEPETGEEDGENPLGQPAAIALALLAIGAFLVERLMARKVGKDPP